MKKPVVGQTLYSLNVGNAARRVEQKLTPVIVKKVGRKYFYCGEEGCREWMHTQYHLDTWKQVTKYTARSSLYETALEYEEEKEASEICNALKNVFEYGRNTQSIPLQILREIMKLIPSKN